MIAFHQDPNFLVETTSKSADVSEARMKTKHLEQSQRDWSFQHIGDCWKKVSSWSTSERRRGELQKSDKRQLGEK